jgi:hypothetical protein
MGCTRCIRCKKLQRDFVGRTFVLIAPDQYVLHQLSCTYETIPNAPKYYETHRNISLGSNGVDGVCSLRKITTLLHGTDICINCTSSVCFASSFMQLQNDPKCTRNTVKRTETLVCRPTWLIGCVRCKKSRRDFAAPTFALIAPVHPVFHRVSCIYEMIPNAPKHYETHQNMSLGSDGVDQVRSLQKITM